MASSNLFPHKKDDSERGTFRHGNNRKTELALKRELDDLTRKSLTEIAVSKDRKKNAPLDEIQATMSKLAPEFSPRKAREKRKSHPIFHDDLRPKSARKLQDKENPAKDVAEYNALDREESFTKLEIKEKKTKKYPFSKEDTVTTVAMRKPHVTSIGIVPIRDSEKLNNLNVLMEGKPALTIDDPVLGPIQRANTAEIDKVMAPVVEEPCSPRTEVASPLGNHQTKPAILGATGTIQAATFTARPPPQPKPKSRPRHVKARTSSALSSLLPDDEVFRKYDGLIESMDQDIKETLVGQQQGKERVEDDRRSQASSTASVKSVKELVDEAKKIASPGTEKPSLRQPKKSETSVSSVKTASTSPRRGTRASFMIRRDKKASKTKGDSKGKHDEGPVSTEKTVDQIIAQLKDQSKSGVISEADRKIQEIMQRVVARTTAVLGDLDGASATPTTSATPVPEGSDGESSRPGELGSEAGEQTERTETEPEPLSTEKGDSAEEEEDEMLEEELEPPAIEITEYASATGTPVGPGTAVLSENDRRSSISTREQHAETSALNQAWEDLRAPPVVTKEDIISVSAKPSQLQPREVPQSSATGTKLLSSWAGKQGSKVKANDAGGKKTIHHFCKMTDEIQLPDQFRGVWRTYHVPSKFERTLNALKGPEQLLTPDSPMVTRETSQDTVGLQQDQLSRQQSAAARRILTEASQTGKDSLEDWKRRAEQVFDNEEMDVGGQRMQLHSDESFLFWTPAPPKWEVPPSRVKQHLFPEYHGAQLSLESQISLNVAEEVDSDIEEEEEEKGEKEGDIDEIAAKKRFLLKKWPSHTDLTEYIVAKQKREIDIASGRISLAELYGRELEEDDDDVRAAQLKAAKRSDLLAKYSVMGEISRQPSPMPPTSETEKVEKPKGPKDLPIFAPLRRARSCEGRLLDEEGDFLLIYEDYDTVMEEIQKQRKQIRDIKHGVAKKPVVKESTSTQRAASEEDAKAAQKAAITEASTAPTQYSFFSQKKEVGPTPAELALEAGRAYVLLPKKSKKKKNVDMSRIGEIEKFIAQGSSKPERRNSVCIIKKPVERELRVPQRIRKHRRSLPDGLDFDYYAERRGFDNESGDSREWVRAIWNRWFDQVFPPPKSSSEESEEEYVEEESIMKEERQTKRRTSISSSVYEEGYEVVEPVVEDEGDQEVLQVLAEEARVLSLEMDKCAKPRAFDLCRRGALYRKLGEIKLSLDDLNKAIEMEPKMLDAYWHRHLVFILQNKKQQALEDLNVILKYNKNHSEAYRSRANVFKSMGDVTMSIINYTQAIKMNPNDAEAYQQRAEMYEQRGEMLLAMEDYATATKLDPNRTDALFKHGLHYFRNENWQSAINDFTELLKQNTNDASARLFRGRAYAKLQQWTPAVEDLSATIHLNPNSWEAFYYRGCILRKLHPKRALQDFSMSLLINDSEDNVSSYLHRGILYNETGRPEDAIPDFEAVLKLNKDMPCAHVNLGLIYMTKYENYPRAIKKFTAALKVDPTYVRAYVCRGEAYAKQHEIKNALLDFTKAIHLQPDVHHYYMYRGQLVLKTGNLDLAAFCVRHAAELKSGLGENPTQQAIVQSFLKNYDKAIEALEGATRVQPHDPALWILLGKTRIKAKQWKESAEAFQKALDILRPHNEKEREKRPWPPEAAEVHFLIGTCQTELRNYLAAHDAFNNAIKTDNKFAEAYYQRGLTRMRLKQAKGIQDFNRALALDPRLFQAYLSRAAYYGLRAHYTKGILNCNEAIKLQPNSVRAYLYRGALKYHIKAYGLAIQDLSQAAAIDNKCALAYFNRAVCYHDSGDHQKALQDYGIVLLLGDALNLKVLINRGLLYLHRKDYSNALHDFLLAARVNPTDKRILHTLGLCYHKLYRLEEAVECFSKSLKTDRFFLDALIGRGNVYMDHSSPQGIIYARRDYERAIHLRPEYLPARVNLAYTLQVAGKFQQAWHQFTKAIAINPRYKPALEGRAIINLQMSNTFAAFQDICTSIKVEPTAELLTNRGVINQFMNDRVNAMTDYQQAIKLDPTYSLAYFNAANMYFHNRQFKQALDYFNLCLKFNDRDESAFLNRAITKVLLKDAEGALKDFKYAIALSPYSAHMYFNRANLHASLNQLDKADADYTKALSLKPDDPLVLRRRADVRGKMGLKEEAITDYRRAILIQSALHRK